MENRERCDPPLDESEVRAIAKSLSQYEPDESGSAVAAQFAELAPCLHLNTNNVVRVWLVTAGPQSAGRIDPNHFDAFFSRDGLTQTATNAQTRLNDRSWVSKNTFIDRGASSECLPAIVGCGQALFHNSRRRPEPPSQSSPGRIPGSRRASRPPPRPSFGCRIVPGLGVGH